MRFCSIKLVFIESTPSVLSSGVIPLHTKHSSSDASRVLAMMALARHSLQNVCKQNSVIGALGDDLPEVNELAHMSQTRKSSLIFDKMRSLYDIVFFFYVLKKKKGYYNY